MDPSEWLVFPRIVSEYDASGRLMLVEDDEHMVAVSLSDDGDDSVMVTLPSASEAPMIGLGPLGVDAYCAVLAGADRATLRDRCGFWNRTAESFVAHWLFHRLGLDLNLHGGASTWGPAARWHVVAGRLGVTIDACPMVGAIAQTHHGFGHVGIVVEVAEDSVTIVDYDYAMSGEFGRRTVLSATYRYLHPGARPRIARSQV